MWGNPQVASPWSCQLCSQVARGLRGPIGAEKREGRPLHSGRHGFFSKDFAPLIDISLITCAMAPSGQQRLGAKFATCRQGSKAGLSGVQRTTGASPIPTVGAEVDEL